MKVLKGTNWKWRAKGIVLSKRGRREVLKFPYHKRRKDGDGFDKCEGPSNGRHLNGGFKWTGSKRRYQHQMRDVN